MKNKKSTSKTTSTKKTAVKKKTVAKKSSVRKVKSSPSKPKSWREKYVAEREEFYVRHPHARVLIGLLIIAFAISVGFVIHDWKEVYVGLTLDEYGIDYPYVEPIIMVQK